MLTLTNVSTFVYENCNNVSTSKGGAHFHTRCPLCGDSKQSLSKKRFHIEFEDDNCKYNCFNCGRSGDFYGIYSEFKGMSRKEAWKKFHTYNSDSIKSMIKPKKIIEQPKTILKSTNFNWILDDCISMDDNPHGYISTQYYNILKQFIIDRKIKIPIFIAYKGKFKDRIILPIYDGEDIIYFQGRTINGNDNKYFNPKVEKQNIIFNKNKFIKNKPIFITEGIIDAQSINNNTTCCLGKEINDDFLDILYTYTNDIYVVLDNDEDGIKSLKKLMERSKHNQKLNYFLMPLDFIEYKDINMIVVDKTNKIEIVEFIMTNSYSIGKTLSNLKWRDKLNEINKGWNRHNNSRWK